MKPGKGTLLLAVVATTAAAVAAAPHRGSDAITSIRFDQRRAAGLLERNDGRLGLSELLREAASVEVRSDAPSRLVLHVYEMRGKDVVRRYASPAFGAPAAGTVSIGRVLPKGEPGFGTYSYDPSDLVEAVKPIPTDAAVEDPGRFVINGVIPYHPKLWERMSAIYVVAAPADRRQSARATVNIGVAFLTAGR